MKILFVITGLGMGGAENIVVRLADSLAEKNHEITIAYLTGDTIVLPANPDVSVVSLGMKSASSFLSAYLKLRRLIVAIQPDIVHSHMVHANLLARLVRISTRIPKLICTAHSTNEGGFLRMLAYRLTDQLADITTNVSREAVMAFEKKLAVPKNKMLAVSNGIDIHKFSPNQTARDRIRTELNIGNKSVFIAVGRLFEAKDYPNLLRAFAKLTVSYSNVDLWIVGDGPLRSDLDKLVKELSISSSVTFFGVRHDVPNLMNAADFFVLSSVWEGFGLVVAEAMATEKIVIATDCGGPGEVLGGCGFLVPVNDSNALMIAMSQALVLSPEKANIQRIKSRERVVSNYSFSRVVDQWVEIYSK